jgi:hypothetical protein
VSDLANQPTLFDTGPAETTALTDRLHVALAVLETAGADGMHADQLGNEIHARRGLHAADIHCPYCRNEGRQAARSLERHGFATFDRRNAAWRPARPGDEAGYDPATAPFPDGY